MDIRDFCEAIEIAKGEYENSTALENLDILEGRVEELITEYQESK